ncbi:MAG: TrmH family RNA methyltransferase [Flavobacteriales bacterium]|nr:TrmH family RNA methyltransferase [Flavobacteriales bacterium]
MRKLKNDELNRKSIDEFKNAEKLPIVIVLNNIRSLNNVGSIFRSSDAFLVNCIYLCGITPQPPHREIQKTALGATESVDWKHDLDCVKVIKELQQDDYEVISIEQADTSIPLQNLKATADKKYAFVFGNEVEGVEDDVLNASDTIAELPQYGTKHSFNVSVCVGMVLWDAVKSIKHPQFE